MRTVTNQEVRDPFAQALEELSWSGMITSDEYDEMSLAGRDVHEPN